MSCSKEELEQFFNDSDSVYIVTQYDSQASEHFCAEVRCKVDGNDYDNFCSEWIRKFSAFSHTNWIVRRTFPKIKRLVFKKVYVCHHNSHNKRDSENSKKNKQCQASMDFKIKYINKNTIKNDEYLKQGLNTIITITFDHSHPVQIAEAFRFLKCDPDVESRYQDYFDSGVTPAAAKECHEMQLCADMCDPQALANGRFNPSIDHVNYLFTKWKKNRHSHRSEINLQEIILQKIKDLQEQGFTIVCKEQPRIIVFLSPIMKRAYSQGLTDDTLFVDTTSACDLENTRITFMFTANETGGLPIACILHTQETEADYTLAVSMTKEVIENEFSQTRFAPGVIMAEDSAAERNALEKIFPSSRLLLCSFHVNQAFWRWLCNSQHGVEKEDRQCIMMHFRDILYSTTAEEAQDNYDNLCEKPGVKCNIKLDVHLNNLWKRRTEWCLAYRNEVITASHNANYYYTEASIQVLKYIVLQRCKVFNMSAFLIFITKILETYHQRRLLAFAEGKKTNMVVYSNFEKGIEEFHKFPVNDNQIQIYSNRKPDIFYTVHIDTATCDCISGQSGKYCKHMFYIERDNELFNTLSPLLSVENRILFAKLALGNDIDEDSYRNISEEDISCIQNLCTLSQETPSRHISDPLDLSSVLSPDYTQTESFKRDFNGSLLQLQITFCKFTKMLSNNKNIRSLTSIRRMTKILGSAQTSEQAYELLCRIPRRITNKTQVKPTNTSQGQVRVKKVQKGRICRNTTKKS